VNNLDESYENRMHILRVALFVILVAWISRLASPCEGHAQFLCSGDGCGPQHGGYVMAKPNEEGGTLHAFAGYDGYLAFGTHGEGNIFEFVSNHLARKRWSNGKEEHYPDITDSYGTHDISMNSDASRIKIGGGKDTDTLSGGRLMMHGNTNVLAPGQTVLSAGNTMAFGSLGEEVGSASLILETRAARPLYLRTGDTTRIIIDGAGVIQILSLQRGSCGLPEGALYRCGRAGRKLCIK
jgi:hypothetical protein